MGEFFDLRTPRDHLKKLQREYAKLQAEPGDVDTAFSFFVTAAQLPELIQDFDYKQSLLKCETILRICNELANRGKHNRGKRLDAVVADARYDSFVERGFVEPGFFEVVLKVTLTMEGAQKLGLESGETNVVNLAALALEFWKSHEAFKERG